MLSIEEIRESIDEIVKRYNVKSMSIFGSYANGTQNETSDIDLVVEFVNDNISLISLFSMKEEISKKLDKEVDLIHGPIKNLRGCLAPTPKF